MPVGTLTNVQAGVPWLFEGAGAGGGLVSSTFPGYTEVDWLEAVDDVRTDVISRERSPCTLTIYVPFAKYKSAVRYILGAAYVEGTSLRRELPVYHPVWPWLYARAITQTTFIEFDGKQENELFGAPAYAAYEWAKLTIEFSEVRYKVLEDSQVTAEYQRYVECKPQPYTELIQIDGGQLKAVAPSIATLDDKPYIGGPYILARIQRSAIDLIWYEVPLSFIQDNNGKRPAFEAALKRVNSATFLGYTVGTLLCEDIEAEVNPAPIVTDVSNSQQFMANVTIHLKHFDPDRGDTAVDKYGWNLLPAPRATGASGDSTVAWLYYTHNGAADGKPLYESYDFAKLFTHHSLA